MSAAKTKVEDVQTEQVEQTEQVSKDSAVKTYVVSVTKNADYCGIGAGGVQFANGKAKITSDRMAAWFREHDGYTVAEE